MALETKLVTATAPGATGDQDVTGTTFTPKAAIVWGSTSSVTDGTWADRMTLSYGITDGTNSRCITYGVLDNNTTSSTARSTRDNQLIWFHSISTPTSATPVGNATFVQWNSDGMRINWGTLPAGAGAEFHVLFLGGSDITDVEVGTWSPLVNAAGSYSKTGMSFQPDYIHLLNGQSDTSNINTAISVASMYFGWATSTSDQKTCGILSENGVGTSDTWHLQDDAAILCGMVTTTGVYHDSMTLTSINSDGWTVSVTKNWNLTALTIPYLAIKGGSYSVGKITEPGSTGNSTTTTSNDCKAVQIFGVGSATHRVSTSQAKISIGAGTSSTERAVLSAHDLDAVGTMINANIYKTSSIYLIGSAASTGSSSATDDEADLNAVSSTGFTLNWTNIGGGLDLYYITFGDAAGAPAAAVEDLAIQSYGNIHESFDSNKNAIFG